MKQFFSFFGAALLANVVFWIISIILSLLFTVVFLAVIFSSEDKKTTTEDNTIVEISLSNVFPESIPSEASLLMSIISAEEKPITIMRLLSTIAEAKTDSHVKGIMLRSSGIAMYSFATAERIRNALLDFKTSGKPVYAYGDHMSEKEYIVASVADKIAMHPQGTFEWDGIAVRLTFFPKLLADWGVKMQIYYAGNFKSATEQFRLDKMSPYNKEQLNVLINQYNEQMLSWVSASRHLSPDTLRKMADSMDVFGAEHAKQKNMVDELFVYQACKENAHRFFLPQDKDNKEDLHYTPVEEYTEAYDEEELLNKKYTSSSEHKIAVLYMNGEIKPTEIDEENYVDEIKDIEKDDKIKAVVVRINSPGGSSLISESLWWQLNQLRKKKPVIMSLADVAASGGYYIASAGDSIFASPLSITGSIGVFGMIPSAEKLMKEKLHLTFDEVSTSPHASFRNSVLSRDLDPVEGQRIQAMVDSTYSTFLMRVATGRHQTKTNIHEIAQGRVWTGKDALKNGLIDGFGYEDRAIRSAALKAKLKEFKVEVYPKNSSSWLEKRVHKLLGASARSLRLNHLVGKIFNAPLLREATQKMDMIQQEATREPQMRIPYLMEGDIMVK